MPIGSPQWMYASGKAYDIPYSCRFDGTAYLKRTMATPTSNQKFSFSFWFKRSNMWDVQPTLFGAGSDGNDYAEIHIHDLDYLSQFEYTGSYHIRNHNSAIVLRDPSAWMHYLIAIDTTQSTADDRSKIYINGVEQTIWGDDDIPAEDYALAWFNSANEWVLGAQFNYSNPFDGYLAEMHWIDGTQLTPASFGETGDYGEWKPIEVSGVTYGTNGFYLDFADSAALGDDVSGESNDFTVVNLAATDQMLDTPTNNFSVMNALTNNFLPATTQLSEGNLKVAATTVDKTIWSTIGVTSGKWYAEVEIVAIGTESHYTGSGVWGSPIGVGDYEGNSFQSYGNSAAMVTGTGVVTAGSINWGSGTKNSDSTAGFAGAIHTIAFDADIGSVWFGKDAAPDTSATANVTGLPTPGRRDYRFAQMEGNTNPGWTMTWNFGQDSSFAGEKTAQGNQDGNDIGDFYYTPPTGFMALCTSNLPEPAVIPSEHFSTVLYTGNAGTLAVTGVGFQSDMLWLKSTSLTEHHCLFDAVRGTADGNIKPNLTNAEAAQSKLASFDSDGFTLNAGSAESNGSGATYIAWNWKANGAGSANTDGNMAETVTVSANVDAGFSIVTYTGDGAAGTVGHGLSKAPDLIIIKNRDVTDEWKIYHSKNTTAPETDWLVLNNANGTSDDTPLAWNDTAPTSSVFTVGTNHSVNADDETYVAYCFHDVDGFSKFGFYTGNTAGAEHKPFVHTGFRPAFVMIKMTSGSDSWMMHDTKIETYNVDNTILKGDTTNALVSSAGYAIDILSNGFKQRGTDGSHNGDGSTYVYMAFAETPFKYANANGGQN